MIVVTTPTGTIGRQVLDNLLANGVQAIRVIVRDPSRLPERVADIVDVVQGSHGDTDIVRKAFAGADAVFWLVPPDPQASSVHAAYVEFSRPASEAFKIEGVNRVVGVSALGRGTPWAAHAGLVTASLAMDDLIATSGVSYRALTMPSFMDNVLRQVEPIKKDGVFSLPIPGDLKQPSCATRDIAAVATNLLCDDSWSGVGHGAVLGPEDLSYNDMAQIMSDVLGKPVRYHEIPIDVFRQRMLARGMSEAMAQANADMWRAYGQGLDTAEPRTPESTTPTSFRQWCEQVLKPAVLA